MWKGTSPDGRHYFPAFPYPSYQRMKLDDVRDLFAYLKTLPPVQGKARDHDVRFPFNIRRLVGGVEVSLSRRPAVHARSRRSRRSGTAAPIWSTARAIARNATARATRSAGSSRRSASPADRARTGEGWVPNITQAGLGDYSVGDIEEILTSGQTPDDFVGGAMVAVVRNTAQLSKEDRAAMAAYIKSLPPVEGPKPPEAK